MQLILSPLRRVPARSPLTANSNPTGTMLTLPSVLIADYPSDFGAECILGSGTSSAAFSGLDFNLGSAIFLAGSKTIMKVSSHL